jgi:hypothetical protein
VQFDYELRVRRIGYRVISEGCDCVNSSEYV